MVAVMGADPGFRAVNTGIAFSPLAASPMAVLELVQVKLAPAGLLVKLPDAMVAPAQLVILAGVSMSGKGATVMV